MKSTLFVSRCFLSGIGRRWTAFLGTTGAAAVSFALLISGGCSIESTPSLFDPEYKGKPDPVITSVSPPSGLAGVTRVTITGSNFSAVKEENLVFFDAVSAQVLQASATQLVVLAPDVIKDSIKVRVGVLGAERFSNTVYHKLDAAVVEMRGISLAEEPWATAVDAEGNIYVSLLIDGRAGGVKKFRVDGARSDYAAARFETKYQSLKFGPDRLLYGAWNVRALAQLPGENVSPILWVTLPIGTKIYDFDFDAQGNIWAAGDNPAIYRVKPDKSIKSFPLAANIRYVRVYSNYLYLAGRHYADSHEKVVRYQILSSDSLGPQEVYFNFSTSPIGAPGKSIYAIAFTSQGDMLVGTDLSDPILLVRPNGSAEPFYPGLMEPTVHILVWGKGTELLAIRGTAAAGAVSNSLKLLRINAQVSGAP